MAFALFVYVQAGYIGGLEGGYGGGEYGGGEISYGGGEHGGHEEYNVIFLIISKRVHNIIDIF